MSGVTYGSYKWWDMNAIDIEWVKARDTGEHPRVWSAIPAPLPANKELSNCLAQDVSNADNDRPWFRLKKVSKNC